MFVALKMNNGSEDTHEVSEETFAELKADYAEGKLSAIYEDITGGSFRVALSTVTSLRKVEDPNKFLFGTLGGDDSDSTFASESVFSTNKTPLW